MIRLDNVTAGYADTVIIDKLSLTCATNSVTAVTGPSGRGKSTLIKVMAGLIAPMSGSVTADGIISVVFQEDRLLPWYTALENVRIVNTSGDAMAALKLVELDEAADKRPAELSGGMKRRTAIARAINYGGDALILDEPFTGLDDALKKRIMPRLRDIFSTIVIISHNEDELCAMGADNVIRL